MLYVLVLPLVLYLGAVATVFVTQRSLLYLPDTAPPVLDSLSGQALAPVSVASGDGLELLSWWAPPRPGRPVVAYFHGNAGSIAGRLFKAQPFLERGFGFLLLEYRGYGGNPGRPSEQGLYADARGALDFIAAQGVEPERVVLYGESLGSGVAVQMAGERRVGAVVLEAPYSSMVDAAAHHFRWIPVGWLLRDRYESERKIATIDAPLLIVHGEEDQTVPITLGRRLFDAARQPKEMVAIPGAGHADLFEFAASRLVVDFVERHLGAKGIVVPLLDE